MAFSAKQHLKIALFGYGKMGKMVDKAAQERHHEIVAILDPHEQRTPEKLAIADICIDFTHRTSVLKNIEQAAKMKKNIILGTTGWHDHLKDVHEIVKKNQIGLLHSNNFSIGIHLFMQVLERAAQLMNAFPEYDVGVLDHHHRAKVDSPSGTAKNIAKTLINNIERKNTVLEDCIDRQIAPEELQVVSLRCGAAPGTHSVYFDSTVDSITLTHQAHGREGFAQGAVRAAEWLQGKKGLFTLEDMMR